MSNARRISIALSLLLAAAAGCSTNAPYEPGDRAVATAATTEPSLTAGVADPTAASAAIADATPPLAANVAIPPAPEPTATQPSSADAPRTHVVAKGDTFFSLSAKYYGTGLKWQAIRDANPGVAPERLPIGKTIVIP